MQRMLMPFTQRVLEVADEMTMVASRADESCAMVPSSTEEVQQREESRQLCRMWSTQRDRGNGADQSKVPKGKTDSAPSRRSSKRSSVGKVPVCKNGEQREIHKNVQVGNAVEVIRVERTCSDIASLTRQSAQSD